MSWREIQERALQAQEVQRHNALSAYLNYSQEAQGLLEPITDQPVTVNSGELAAGNTRMNVDQQGDGFTPITGGNIHLTRNVYIQHQHRAENTGRDFEEKLRASEAKNEAYHADLIKTQNLLREQQQRLQEWSSGVEGKILSDNATEEELKEKIEQIVREICKMQTNFSDTIKKNEERTNDMNKMTLDHVQHLAKTVVPPGTLDKSEEPLELLKRREEQKKNLQKRVQLIKSDNRPMTKWKMSYFLI